MYHGFKREPYIVYRGLLSSHKTEKKYEKSPMLAECWQIKSRSPIHQGFGQYCTIVHQNRPNVHISLWIYAICKFLFYLDSL